MPQLNKVRIVNFRYNDGKRLIADEIFSFADSQGRNLNTLITLVNGGGKSVLVQAMLQPLLPKAKVAGRKIESFFRKPSDHFFVVLEWAKDDSRERLLTGIAMKASESASDSDNETKLGVSFYLFCLSNSVSEQKYDLEHLPLSEYEGGGFKVSDFKDFRKFLKSARDKDITCISDSDGQWKSVWRAKLGEFGISSHEWQMIEKLNSDEGGMSKFFEKYRRSDDVVDGLLIDCIERGTELNSENLGNYLYAYVKGYREHESNIRKERALGGLLNELRKHEDYARECWDLHDKKEICLEKLFLFQEAILRLKTEMEAEAESLNVSLDSCQKELSRIKWEKASDGYYRKLEEKKKAEEEKRRASEHLESVKVRLRDVKYQLDLLFCAEQFGLFNKANSEIEALYKAIADKENENANSAEIKSLKYSLGCQLSELIPQEEEKKAVLLSEFEKVKKNLAEVSESLKGIEAKQSRLQQEAYRLKGRAEESGQRIESSLQSLKIENYRSLLKDYDLDLIGEVRKEWQAEADSLAVQLERAETELRVCDEKLEASDAEKDELSKKRWQADNDLKNAEKELAAFDRSREAIEAVIKRRELSLTGDGGVFSPALTGRLDEEIKICEGRRDSFKIEESLKKDLIKAVKEGHVHVPRAVIDFLDGSGLEYETFEACLQRYIKDGSLTTDEVGAILDNYPPAAYGIVVSEENREKLKRYCEENRAEWLPAMVPVFTEKQFRNVLEKRVDKFVALAFYSRDYFASREDYGGRLSAELSELQEKADKNGDRLAGLVKDRQAVSEFLACYSAAWLQEKQAESSRFKSDRDRLAEDIKNLEAERSRLKAESKDCNRKIKNLGEKMRLQENKLNKLADTIDDIVKYDALLDDIRTKEDELGQFERKIENLKEQIEVFKRKGVDLERELKASDELLKEMHEAKAAAADAREGELRAGEWRELYTQYKTLSAAQSEAIDSLRGRLEEKQKDAEGYKSKLEDRSRKGNVSPEAYESCSFSEEKREGCEAEEARLEDGKDKANEALRSLERKSGKADSDFNSACAALGEFGGEPLPAEEVKADFEKRIKAETQRKNELTKVLKGTESQLNSISSAVEMAKESLFGKKRSHKKTDFVPADDFRMQWKELKSSFTAAEEAYAKADREERERLLEFCRRYENGDLMAGHVRGLKSAVGITGDIYYSLTDRLSAFIKSCEQERGRLRTDLQDFANQKNDVVRKFWEHGGVIYDGLKRLSDHSKVRLENKTYKQLLRIDIPESVDNSVSLNAIENELDRCVEELAEKLKKTEINEEKLKDECRRASAGSKLLRTYIDKKSVSLQAFKFEANLKNAVYRDWSAVQTNNSGAEKFLVYFAIVLSLMRYTRQAQYSESINSSKKYGALILDNPFGAVSSGHVLKPMFDMARHFKVQLICLSDITKSDVVTNFDKVIKAVVKGLSSSSMEKLALYADGESGLEELEHGYYQKELL